MNTPKQPQEEWEGMPYIVCGIHKKYPCKCIAELKAFIKQIKQEERQRSIEVVDGSKEVYREGENKGKEKEEWDSCCNETLNYVLEKLTKSTHD